MSYDLLRYYPAFFLQAAWLAHQELRLERAQEPGRCIKIIPTGPTGASLVNMRGGSEKDLCTTAMSNKSLGLFMQQGPVIIRPDLNLCQALLDTQINMSTVDYKMPFPVMGVELPEAIIKPHYPSLMLIWKPFPDVIYDWTLSPHGLCTYYELFGADISIEQRLEKAEGCEDESEYKLQVLGGRIALNLCMLAAHRETKLSDLPKNTVRHRRGRDPRLQQLAARECQEISFRDLIIRRSATIEEQPHEGERWTQAKHLRRGHWKRVPYGERALLRKWNWINPYWTHPEQELPAGGGGTVILQ